MYPPNYYRNWQIQEILTFEEDYFVVPRPLIHSIQTVKIRREAPPESMDLSGTKRHQVLLSS